MAAKIRRNDEVVVIAGKDKGRRGKVLAVRPDDRVLVAGVNLVKKHTKPNPMLGKQGGIVEKEAAINISNVMLICSSCSEAARTGIRTLEDGSRVRYCKKCNENVDK